MNLTGILKGKKSYRIKQGIAPPGMATPIWIIRKKSYLWGLIVRQKTMGHYTVGEECGAPMELPFFDMEEANERLNHIKEMEREGL